MENRNPEKTEEFIRLITQHQSAVFLFICSLLPHRADAEEVLQETNLLLWKKFDEYQSGTNFRAWAMQFAAFRIKKFFEQAQRSKLQFGQEFIDRVAMAADASLGALEQRQQALEQCMQQLPEKDRELIQLRYLAEGTVESVSQATGRSVEAVYKAIQRARRALHDCIQAKLAVEES